MRFDASALTEHAASLLVAAGADEVEARSVAESLVWCDRIDRPTQGVSRLPILIERLAQGLYQSPCRLEVERRAAGVSVLDGGNGLGHWLANRGMDAAIELAQDTGIGVVGVRNGNFFGAGACYVERAAARGMIGLAMSNSFPKVAAHGGVKSILGTNPFAFGAPRRSGRSVLLDMATAASAGSMIRMYADEGRPLPEGIAVDAMGRPITDPSQVASGALLPFGGAKGWGLMFMVEIMAGVITGAGIGPGVKSMYADFENGGRNGFLFLALDIERFMPLELYFERMEELVALVRSSADAVKGLRVLYPGESRWVALACSDRDGVFVGERTVGALEDLARKLGVPLLAV